MLVVPYFAVTYANIISDTGTSWKKVAGASVVGAGAAVVAAPFVLA